MQPGEAIILVTDEKIYFNKSLCIPISQSNLPCEKISSTQFDFVFWKLKQKTYNKTTGELTADVIDYFSRKEDVQHFYEQRPKFEIRKINFLNLRDPATLADAIRYYHRHIHNAFQEDQAKYEAPEKTKMDFNLPERERKIRKKFDVYFKDAAFKLGYVGFSRYIEEVDAVVDFKIENDNILGEYEYIKGYFPKALKTRKFTADTAITCKGREVIHTYATSAQVDAIDEKIIESIKINRTLSLTRSPVLKEPDKSLFTSDEIFNTIDSDDAEGNIFKQNEEDILRFLIDVKKVRNRRQLEYLAGRKQSPARKLQFTLSPHFGFLFLLEGKTMYHYCWELLNSHATYMWSMEKEPEALKLQYRRIEDVINSIRQTGRDKYKSAYRHNHLDEDLLFSVINHTSINSNFKDGFVEWKHKLEERLV